MNGETTISHPTASASPKEIQVYENDVFNYDGYQVVRGEFFSHIYEPSFTLNNNKVYVNTACIRKLPDTDYMQILVNSHEKKLAVRPCHEDEKDSLRWCSATQKRSPRQVTCRIFFAKVMELMNWNPNYRYKLLGKLIRSDDELLFVFDLTTPEIFVRTPKDDVMSTAERTPVYPAEWENQFGVPAEEHQNNLQINMFNGYAVFGISESNNKSKTINGNSENGNLYQQKEAQTNAPPNQHSSGTLY